MREMLINLPACTRARILRISPPLTLVPRRSIPPFQYYDTTGNQYITYSQLPSRAAVGWAGVIQEKVKCFIILH